MTARCCRDSSFAWPKSISQAIRVVASRCPGEDRREQPVLEDLVARTMTSSLMSFCVWSMIGAGVRYAFFTPRPVIPIEALKSPMPVFGCGGRRAV